MNNLPQSNKTFVSFLHFQLVFLTQIAKEERKKEKKIKTKKKAK